MKVEYYHCSSDPSSLDGVIIEDMRCAVIDGTAPHTTDPAYPAAADSILNFGAFIDVEKAGREREAIVGISKKISGLYSDVRSILGVASALYRERMKETEKHLLYGKMQKCALKHNTMKGGAEIYPYAAKGIGGIRWLSSSAPSGGRLDGKINELFTVYPVVSRRGASRYFIETAADIAERSGNTVIRCPAPRYGGLEAALVCDTGVAYVSTDDADARGRINADRFVESGSSPDGYARLCRKIERRLNSAADAAFDEISRLHRELEEIYGACTDFESLTEYTLAAEETIFRMGRERSTT